MTRWRNPIIDGPEEDDMPTCPCCGGECETIFFYDGEPVGCDQCLEKKDAWEYREEQRDMMRDYGRER